METSLDGRSDSELIGEFIRTREGSAFEEIVRRHGGMVLGVCRSVLGNTSDAEDAAQAVFLTLALKTPRGHDSLVGWLHRVAWYVARRGAEAREIRRRHEKEAGRMRPSSISSDSELPLGQLHEGLACLPEKYRVAMLLHHVEGRTQEETAALLGCGVSAVAMRLSRGREMLRRKLGRQGVVATTGAIAATLHAQAGAHAAPAFIAMTGKAAVAALSGKLAASAGVPTVALALSQRAIHMLFWAKIKAAAMMAMCVMLIGGAGVYVAIAATAAPAKPSIAPHASSLATTPASSVHGIIQQVGAASLTLQTSEGSVSVAFDDTTIVKVNGTVTEASALKRGMHAIAFVDAGLPATEIRAYTPKPPTTQAVNPANVFGVVTAASGSSMTVEYSGKSTVVPFTAATTFTVNQNPGTAADLQIGMHAIASLASDHSATTVKAYMPTTRE